MKERSYYIFVGGAENYEFFERNIYRRADEQWFWTALKSARRGDRAFVYLCAPVSRIVGRVELVGDPFYNIDMFENPKTRHRWMAEIGEVVYYFPQRELTIRGLREIFDDWGWVWYPRGNTKIPSRIVSPFMELIGRCSSQYLGRRVA